MSELLKHIRAAALFASDLQRSAQPPAREVRSAVAGAIHAYGSPGCAELVAAEFGEHPETAVARMSWALEAVRASFPAALQARTGCVPG
jgi:hypothetical protein